MKQLHPFRITNLLIYSVSLSITLIILTYGVFFVSQISNEYHQDLDNKIKQSLNALEKNITPLLKSYSQSEYENMLINDIHLNHYNAIVIEDYELGVIFGQKSVISGFVHSNDEISPYSEQSKLHKEIIEKSNIRESINLSQNGKILGKITIFHDDLELLKQISQQSKKLLLQGILLIVILSFAIYFISLKLIIRPLQNFMNQLQNLNSDGIPKEPIPNSFIIELNQLATTINKMLNEIQKNKNLLELSNVKLESEQERFRLAIEGTKDGLWDWDLKSNYAYHSPRFETMLGYEVGELTNTVEAWSGLLHDDDKEQAFKTVEHYLKTLGQDEYESVFRMRTKDGGYRWIKGRGKALFDSDGQGVRFLGFNTDITDEVLAKERIKSSELRWKFAIEGNKDGLWDWNLETNEVYFSAQWKKMLGFKEYEIEASLDEWTKRVNPKQLDNVLKDVRDYLEERSEQYYNEHQVLCKDGSYKWILDRGIIVERDKEGKPLRMIGTHTDISKQKELQKEILFEKNFVSTIVDTANAIIAVIQSDGTMSRLNKYGEKFTGFTTQEVASEPYFWKRFLNEKIRENVVAIIENAKQGNITKKYQNTWINHNGEEKMFEWSNQMVQDENGNLDYIFTIGIDIQEQIEIQHQIIEQKEELEVIFNTTLEGIAILDFETNFLVFNKQYLNILGYTQEELHKIKCFELTSNKYLEASKEVFKEVRERGYYENFERDCITKSGAIKRLNSSISLLPNKEQYLISTSDVTERYKYINLIKQQTYIDELTQLNNRKSFNKRVEELLEQYKRYKITFSFIMFDIDNFKSINDTYGHDVGDKVLIRLGELISTMVRENDYLFRVGGEEFVILLTDTNGESGLLFAEKIRKNIELKLDTIEDRVVTISLGVTEVEANDTADSIYKRADDALYKSKESGRNKSTRL